MVRDGFCIQLSCSYYIKKKNVEKGQLVLQLILYRLYTMMKILIIEKNSKKISYPA